MNGHKEKRCLKVWQGNYTEAQMRFIKCVQCGKNGHLKCTSEKKSKRIPIDPTVEQNLNEFLKNRLGNRDDGDDQDR